MSWRNWRKWALVGLLSEKIAQHFVVTIAFYSNWQGIRATVVADPDFLMVAGGLLALLFVLNLWAVVTRQRWAVDLAIGLALCDIFGEFYAQGTFAILITFSFLVAIVLLLLALSIRRRWINHSYATHPQG